MTARVEQNHDAVGRQASLSAALRDIFQAVLRWRLWMAFAIEDLRQTYRRSLLGVLWISFGFAIFVAVKIFIFGTMLDRANDQYYSAYLMIGFYIWFYVSSSITSGTGVFINSEGWIRNDPIELPVFVFQNVVRHAFDLLMTGLVVVIGMVYLGLGASAYTFMVLPALLALLVNALWVNLLLGVLCLRFRDLVHLINAIIRVMFFMTPIFWLPEQLPARAMELLYWNPFAHFIWIFRTPIIDQQFALDSWIYVSVLTIIGWIAAILAYAITRRRLVFWF
ncbi:ABC transporter permease [Maricaulaceae bacterium EIL42A08]|nr:ABC transporter permease [Maricaulaceae bacterium EIL42A08]